MNIYKRKFIASSKLFWGYTQEYDIRLYDNLEQIISSLLHEHTHTLQDQKEFKKLYDKGYNYGNHPFELEALEAEKNWKNYK